MAIKLLRFRKIASLLLEPFEIRKMGCFKNKNEKFILFLEFPLKSLSENDDISFSRKLGPFGGIE